MDANKKVPMKHSKGDVTREAIIDSAAKLFIDHGFTATTTRQITDELNMTRGIIYNYFKSKDEIFVAVINKFHPWLQIVSAVKNANGETIEILVASAKKTLTKEWDKHPEMTKLHFIELVEFNGEHLPNLFDRVFNEMIEILDEKIQNKEKISSMRIATLSRALLGLFFAYLMSDKFTGISGVNSLTQGANGIDFDYFTDIYLSGINGKFDSAKSEDEKE